MMADLVLSETIGEGILVLTLNAPERHNPISDKPMLEAVIAAMEQADADPSVRVIVLTGAGKSFSSGGNVAAMKRGGPLNPGSPAQTRQGYKTGIQRLPLLFESLEVPVIAAVNGAAIGAGCDLACMCDIRIASEHAVFAESFVRLGLIPGDGGAWLLPRVVGFAKASEMALTGERLDAQAALACGLVSRVAPADGLLDEALLVARMIAANPRHAVRMTKRLLRSAYRASLPEVLETSAAMQAVCHATADHEEAVNAFLEKREPRFRGE
jgi:enoyl-CoA hydratase/carnithine racemase